MSGLVADRVRAALPVLPRAERRVAHELLAGYPVSGLETVARLAERARVSGPTVIRLVARLGYDGYPDFQAALRMELEQRTASPLVQYQRREPLQMDDHLLARSSEQLRHDLEQSLDLQDQAAFAAAVDMMVSTRRRILTAGGRFSGLIARNLHQHLSILRSGCRHLEPDDWVTYLLEAKRSDVLIVFDMRRYQSSTVQFGQEAARRGVSLIVITDQWMSPLARDADVVLVVSVESVSPFDSLVPALALVETLLAGAIDRLGDHVPGRVRDYDELWAARDFAYDEHRDEDR